MKGEGLWTLDIVKGSLQIQIPLVHGLMVGATPKPKFSFLFNITRFKRKDFPVLYLPTKLIIPMLLLHFCDNNFLAASEITNFPSSKVTKGNAVCFGGI